MEKIFLTTMGCSVNHSESEVMAGLLKEVNFELVSSPDLADVIVINICTVKGDKSALRIIKKLSENKYKSFVIAGCITPEIAEEVKKTVPKASLVSTHNIEQIVSVVEETMNDNPISVLEKQKEEKICMPRSRRNPAVAIIPISQSCQGACTYCSVKLLKGEFFSYKKESIINEAKRAIKENCKEMWVTSQDNGCYGNDIGTSLPALLKEIIALPGEFKIRLGMLNPNHAIELADELIPLFNSDKMFRFLHIPVQSGNNEILKKMGRKYTAQQFKDVVTKFRQAIPGLTIATDIIAGFPTEKKDDFADSIELIKEIKPDVINISKYVSRPGTKAARLREVPGHRKKIRSRKLTQIFEHTSFDNNRKWKNWKGDIIIDEKGKDNTWVGRNYAYKPVVIEGNFKLGDIVKVSVFTTTIHDLRAVPNRD